MSLFFYHTYYITAEKSVSCGCANIHAASCGKFSMISFGRRHCSCPFFMHRVCQDLQTRTLVLHHRADIGRQMWGPVEMLQGWRAAVRLQLVAVESVHVTGRGGGTSAELDVGR